MKEVRIFTDGACSGNPGPGGCAAILTFGNHRKELSEGYRYTTNNRMELKAVIMGLSALKFKCDVEITTDSKYVMSAFEEGWLERWKSNGWRTKGRTQVQNIDLWKSLEEELSKHHWRFEWIKGHSGHSENTKCDFLAVKASKEKDLKIDIEFERNNPIPIKTETSSEQVGMRRRKDKSQ